MAHYPDLMPRDIPEDALDKFIALYKREFKEDIAREDARVMAYDLIRLYRVLARPLSNERDPAKQPGDASEEVSRG